MPQGFSAQLMLSLCLANRRSARRTFCQVADVHVRVLHSSEQILPVLHAGLASCMSVTDAILWWLAIQRPHHVNHRSPTLYQYDQD